ncbi:MAG: GNAT family N-acetyltransferase [Micropepsaceae bacterium]
MSNSRADVQMLEELNFNAWPALHTVHHDGWLIRKTGGSSRRVNSANALSPGVLPLEEKVRYCEALFDGWKQRRVFRVTPLADPALAGLLAARGYEPEAPTFVQVAQVKPFPIDARVTVSDRFDPAWSRASAAMRGLAGDDAVILEAQHRAIAIPTLWASARVDGEIAAVGAVAVERGWAGLHGIYVSRSVRRAGLARAISKALLGGAHQLGASRAWLQVEQGNSAALPLYGSLGFETEWAYQHLVLSATTALTH